MPAGATAERHIGIDPNHSQKITITYKIVSHSISRTGPTLMHILITANTAWNVAHFRKPVISALLADGHSITVLSPPDDNAPTLVDMGCRFIPLWMDAASLNPFRELMLLLSFWRIFRSEKPDAVLSFTIKNNIFGAIAARWAGVTFIPNITGLGTAFLSGPVFQWIAEGFYKYAFRNLDTVFFQNTDDLNIFLERDLTSDHQARLLPGSGIDLDHFALGPLPPAGTPVTFLMIARLIYDKGVREYVEAARLVKQEFPDARFRLLGPLDVENRTAVDEVTLRNWVSSGRVEYVGSTHDVREHIKAAHCIVLPSYREGCPRTLLEAAAMGRPLITSDVPGCRSVVDEGVSGVFCEAKSAESLAQAMRRLILTPSTVLNQMGKASRSKMEREFDEDIVVSAYRRVISEAAHN